MMKHACVYLKLPGRDEKKKNRWEITHYKQLLLARAATAYFVVTTKQP